MSKRYDIVAVVGEYTNANGETKKKYLNVGVVMQGDNGPYILMSKTFNPAGLAEQGKDSIILSLFEPRPKDSQPQQSAPQQSAEFVPDQQIPF